MSKRMQNRINDLFAAAILLAGMGFASVPGEAFAQAADAGFEITPWAGYRVGGNFDDTDSDAEIELQESNSWGVTVNGAVRPDGEWEFLYAKQSTSIDASGAITLPSNLDVDVHYLQIGGTYLFDGDRARPFIALTIGASRFELNPGDFGAKTFFSGSLGGGWKAGLGENLAVRIEGRVYSTIVDDDSSLFCESSGGTGSCLIVLDGNLFTQWEARAGFTVRF